MKMPLRLISGNIIKHYRLCAKALDAYVYVEIRKGMCGLPQAGILANKLLNLHLARHGYFEQLQPPSHCKHASQPIWFNLCVDNFGIKNIGDEHLKHLFAALWTGHTKLLKNGRAISIVVSLLCMELR
jgi:hypothetical protein